MWSDAVVLRKAIYSLGLAQHPPLGRVVSRVERGCTLINWSMRGPTAPDFPDSDSSLARDDAPALPEIPPRGVVGAAVGPIMWATDQLSALHILTDQVAHTMPFNHHAASFMSLCRTAFECSSQAIWVMSSPDREIRRRRAAGMSLANVGDAKRYLDGEISLALGRGEPGPTLERDEVQGWIAELNRLGPQSAKPTARVIAAGRWIQDNSPPHLAAEIGSRPIGLLVEQQYNVCSSFSHGETWPATLVGGDISSMFSMMADAIAVAVYVTECAVALIEAHATTTGSTRAIHYPDRLSSTIRAWQPIYSWTD